METLRLVIFEKTHEAAIERGLIAARELLGPPENSNVAGTYKVMHLKVHRSRPDRTDRVRVGDWYIESAESDATVIQMGGSYEATPGGVETTIVVRRKT